MRYDISKASAPSIPNLKKIENTSKNLLKMPQKSCNNLSFPMIFPSLCAFYLVVKFSLKATFLGLFAQNCLLHT